MSEEPLHDPLADLPRPEPPSTWGERVAGWAESLDLTPIRLVVGLVVLAVGGFVAWRLLAPPPLPPEMRLPFASTSVAPAAGGQAGSPGGEAGSSGGPSGGVDPAAGAAGGAGGGRLLEVVVHVAGAVRTPGVQRLESDARVIDAVDAAGGPAGEADLARVNLAAPLQDGQQVYVPRMGELVPPVAAAGPGGGTAGDPASATGGPAGTAGGLVNLNQATPEELEELPGVGPAIAQAIIDHRQQQGPFTSVEQLLDVRGIGDARFADLQDLVTV